MFNNLEELKAEILQGKTNEEIIQERLSYLTSEEYKSKRLPIVKRYDTNQALFFDGFISEEERIAFNAGRVSDCLYIMDDKIIYEILINYLRNNMDERGVRIKGLIQIVRDYFKVDENSIYYELSEYLKKFSPRDPYFARETMPYIISEYSNSNFNGSVKDFGIGHLHHWINSSYNYDALDIDELDKKYFESIDWENLNGDMEIPISKLKGSGIAACTEYSILTQNLLAFLGLETYLLGGELDIGDKKEGHNFNIIRARNGGYQIIDSAQIVYGNIENATSLDDIRNMKNIPIKRFGATELRYIPAGELRTIKKPRNIRNIMLNNDKSDPRD